MNEPKFELVVKAIAEATRGKFNEEEVKATLEEFRVLSKQRWKALVNSHTGAMLQNGERHGIPDALFDLEYARRAFCRGAGIALDTPLAYLNPVMDSAYKYTGGEPQHVNPFFIASSSAYPLSTPRKSSALSHFLENKIAERRLNKLTFGYPFKLVDDNVEFTIREVTDDPESNKRDAELLKIRNSLKALGVDTDNLSFSKLPLPFAFPLNPWAGDLTDEQKAEIVVRCKNSPAYFYQLVKQRPSEKGTRLTQVQEALIEQLIDMANQREQTTGFDAAKLSACVGDTDITKAYPDSHIHPIMPEQEDDPKRK